MSELVAAANDTTRTEKGFFGKLANGDFGLAKTYWLYGVLAGGVLVGVVGNIFSNVVTSIGGLVIFMLASTAYEIPVFLGTWRAANKYQGPKIWAVLAKIAVVLGATIMAVCLLAVIGLLGQA